MKGSFLMKKPSMVSLGFLGAFRAIAGVNFPGNSSVNNAKPFFVDGAVLAEL